MGSTYSDAAARPLICVVQRSDAPIEEYSYPDWRMLAGGIASFHRSPAYKNARFVLNNISLYEHWRIKGALREFQIELEEIASRDDAMSVPIKLSHTARYALVIVLGMAAGAAAAIGGAPALTATVVHQAATSAGICSVAAAFVLAEIDIFSGAKFAWSNHRFQN